MKRVASESPNRYDYPFTDPIAGETPSDVIDVTPRQPVGLTIEELRDLALPPFTFGIRCESQNGKHTYYDTEVNEFGIQYKLAIIKYDGGNTLQANIWSCNFYGLLNYCARHACDDALVWFLLRVDEVNFEDDPLPNLDAGHVRYLMACMERLPGLVTVRFHNFWSNRHLDSAFWKAFVDELPRSKVIKGYSDAAWRYSEQQIKRFLSAIKDHPVISELGIGFSTSTAAALNQYLAHNTTLQKLVLRYLEPQGVFPTSDIIPGLRANYTLSKLALGSWPITPALASVFATKGKVLKKLSLIYCTFMPGALTALGNALVDNHSLSSLRIEPSNFPVEEQKSFYDAFRFSQNLETLEIHTIGDGYIDTLPLWEMLQVNLTLQNMNKFVCPYAYHATDHLRHWSLRPQIQQRVRENKELPLLANQYPMAKLALSVLPGNLPSLPPDVSDHIARLLLKTDASALPSYRTLHMLALHKAIKAQHKPAFPDHPDLARNPAVQLLARSGTQALPLPPDALRSLALFCIRHQATDALNWLIVHACKGRLDLRGSRFEPGEAGWLIHWTRAAPCHIKLRLDQVALTKHDIADIARHLRGNPSLTSLSLQGCAMTTEDLQLICAALKTNMAMVELLLSKDLIVPGKLEAKRSQELTTLEGGIVVDGKGKIIKWPETVSVATLQPLARYRDEIATRELCADMSADWTSPKYFLLSAIAFSLRRNIRLQNRVPTSDDFYPDKAFVDDLIIASDER